MAGFTVYVIYEHEYNHDNVKVHVPYIPEMLKYRMYILLESHGPHNKKTLGIREGKEVCTSQSRWKDLMHLYIFRSSNCI